MPQPRTAYLGLAATAVFTAICAFATAQVGTSSLEQNFRNPPDSAKPRAWWHWMSGNVTEPGITADLEWMHRVGIGGMQMFDGDMGAPLFVDKPVIWMSPEWKSAWRHAAAEADRLHLEMSMAASGGWSETAGPWVQPEQAMKKYVWSETAVDGSTHFHGLLAQPPATIGKFQDLQPAARRETRPDLTLPGAHPQPPLPSRPPTPELYKDAAVIAYPLPPDEAVDDTQKPQITCSCGPIDASALTDGSFAKIVEVPFAKGDEASWIQFAYPEPRAVQSILFGAAAAVAFGGPALPAGKIEASGDGNLWRTLVELPGSRSVGSVNFAVRTYSIEQVKARFYRLSFVAPKLDPLRPPPAGTPWPPPVRLTEIQLLAGPRVQSWEDKASFGVYTPGSASPAPDVPVANAIDPAKVIDLTGKMQPDGTLDWEAPPGKWIVLRLGYGLTGEVNHPATPEATGLEVDKLSARDVQAYVEQYAKMISGAAGPYFGKSFRYFLMDSWEAGQENWTEEMLPEFARRRGYSMTKYLPVLTGRIVGSRAQSEAFLWDFRRTQADMLADNHYAVATKYFAKFGVGLYAEAMGTGMPTTGDGLLNKGQVTIPMGEFWTPLPDQKDTATHIADVMEAASAAHIYGKPIAATESFTTRPYVTPWGQSPFYLKSLADQDFARGINRIVFHTSDLQPFVDNKHRPGMTLGPYGQDYTRNITWAEQAVVWNTYLARCSYLLQQGKPYSDVAYFYGEDAPATVPFWKKIEPALPAHYGADFVDADVLLHGATAAPGHLRLASGTTYRLLVLPADLQMLSLPLLRSIHTLVAQGAVLLGQRPIGSPSLADGPGAQQEVSKLADDLWGSADESARGRSFGKGKVYSGVSIEDVLAAEKAPQDFSWSAPENVGVDVPYSLPGADSDEDLLFIHRHDRDRDIYFVSTQKHHGFDVKAAFAVSGEVPTLWHPESGATEAVSYSAQDGKTTVPLHFDAQGSVFVVFDRASTHPSQTIPKPSRTQLTSVEGGWNISFPPDLGAPAEASMPALQSWTLSAEPGVKYFSGTATYHKQIEAPKEWFKPGERVILDLGTVKEMAEVEINGKPVGGILWKPPFTVDATGLLKPGQNELTVRVTNLWPNRMIGDLQPGVTQTYTWTDFRPFKADSPLMESGLLGPVTVWAETR
jgi:alpha-L-rhamnosidase